MVILEYFAILSMGVTASAGAIAAGRKKMDIFGVIIIACIAALGGGMVRDILFGLYPLTWVMHPDYLVYAASCALITILLARFFLSRKTAMLFLILDAIGLSGLVILGVQKVLPYHYPPLVIMISGMITGVSGGMLRDILCNDIPLVLRKELYAIIALFGAWFFLVLRHYGVPDEINMLITVPVIFIIRLWAILCHIEMPKFDYMQVMRKHHRRR